MGLSTKLVKEKVVDGEWHTHNSMEEHPMEMLDGPPAVDVNDDSQLNMAIRGRIGIKKGYIDLSDYGYKRTVVINWIAYGSAEM